MCDLDEECRFFDGIYIGSLVSDGYGKWESEASLKEQYGCYSLNNVSEILPGLWSWVGKNKHVLGHFLLVRTRLVVHLVKPSYNREVCGKNKTLLHGQTSLYDAHVVGWELTSKLNSFYIKYEMDALVSDYDENLCRVAS